MVIMIIMRGDDKNNLINTDGGDDRLYGGGGNDVLNPGWGNDFVYGDEGDDVLVLTGSGTQHFDGGDGIDTFEIYLPNYNSGSMGLIDLNISLQETQMILIILSDTLENIENVKIITLGGYIIKGDETNNILTGGSGNDIKYWGW